MNKYRLIENLDKEIEEKIELRKRLAKESSNVADLVEVSDSPDFKELRELRIKVELNCSACKPWCKRFTLPEFHAPSRIPLGKFVHRGVMVGPALLFAAIALMFILPPEPVVSHDPDYLPVKTDFGVVFHDKNTNKWSVVSDNNPETPKVSHGVINGNVYPIDSVERWEVGGHWGWTMSYYDTEREVWTGGKVVGKPDNVSPEFFKYMIEHSGEAFKVHELGGGTLIGEETIHINEIEFRFKKWVIQLEDLPPAQYWEGKPVN